MSKKVTCRLTTNLALVQELDRSIFNEGSIPDGAIWWLAYVGTVPVGYAGLKIWDEEGRRYGYLCRAGVLPEYRGKGIQLALIKVRDRMALRRKVGVNITYVADWNLGSANNLVRCGYSLYHPTWRYGFKDALYFRKSITKNLTKPVEV